MLYCHITVQEQKISRKYFYLIQIQPAESFLEILHLLLLLLFHYDYDLTYKRFGASATMALNKNPRSQIAEILYFLIIILIEI
jgi:hypothetical protein